MQQNYLGSGVRGRIRTRSRTECNLLKVYSGNDNLVFGHSISKSFITKFVYGEISGDKQDAWVPQSYVTHSLEYRTEHFCSKDQHTATHTNSTLRVGMVQQISLAPCLPTSGSSVLPT